MGKYKYLANNIALFSISNFVSKILVFLLVPFYTNVLTTAEYGIADIFQVTLLLLVPALTINMGEGALRFGIEKKNKRGSILYTGLKFTVMAAALVALVCFIASFFVSAQMKWYLFLFSVLFLSNALYEFLILYFQGSEMVGIVVIGSILSTLTMIVCNLIFLLKLKIGLNGYLYSQMIAFAAAVLTMLLLRAFRLRKNKDEMGAFTKDKEIEREMLDYGKPLILYSTGSWINNAADRYLVSAICSTAVNGVYGVAYKIPAILTVFQRIFAQAWQMSATKSYKEDKSEEFFTTMYKAYHTFMVLACSFLIVIVKLMATFLFRKEFFTAWQYVPPLLISVVFGAMTGFIGSICLAYKDSKAMGMATGIGALVNVVLNIISIPYLSAMGAAIATAISYYIMYILAFIKVRKYVKIRVSLVRDYISYLLLIAQAVIVINEIKYAYIINTALFIVLAAMYYREVIEIIKKLYSKLVKHEE